MQGDNRKVVIIGGGITGLAAAYYLQKYAKDSGQSLDVKLVEATHRLGGKVQTMKRDGFVIERGPDSFLARKKSAYRLAKEVGLENDLVTSTSGKSFVLARERLHPMPGGSIMGIPTEVAPFITTSLFSPGGKLRAAADFLLPRSAPISDQSLGGFFRRRLGDEVVENLIEPLLSGIYAGDIDQLSLMSTFPQFYQVEQKHRSLILGMKKAGPSQQKKEQHSEKKQGAFLTVKTGLESFIQIIESKLDRNSVYKGYRTESITKVSKGYKVSLNGGIELHADSVVLAVPHHAARSILADTALMDQFSEMPATSVATIALAFPEEAIVSDIDGSGFVVSRNCDYTITACTWTHKKWPHTAPKGKVLLRCYVGRANDDTIVDLSDDAIIAIVLEDLRKTMEIIMEPDFAVITRWKDSMPQYIVGHKSRVNMAQQMLSAQMPGVFFAGSSYEGLGVPDCIDQGVETVRKVLEHLQYPVEKATFI